MTNAYSKAYTEVLEIIKNLPEDEYKKIPKEEIEFYENHKDKNYEWQYNPNVSLNEQNISREANAIIVTIFRDFFATNNQKEKLKGILAQNENEYQEELKEKYSYENLFKNRKKVVKEEPEELSVTEYKENIFVRIFNKIRKFFNRSEK